MSYYTTEELLGALDNAPAGPDTVFEPMEITRSDAAPAAPRAGRQLTARRRPNFAAAAARGSELRQAAAQAAADGGYYLPEIQPQSKGIPSWVLYLAGGVGVLGLGYVGYRMVRK